MLTLLLLKDAIILPFTLELEAQRLCVHKRVGVVRRWNVLFFPNIPFFLNLSLVTYLVDVIVIDYDWLMLLLLFSSVDDDNGGCCGV